MLAFKNRPSDLLILDLANEPRPWRRLCDFLGLPAPDMPFPHLKKPGIGELRRVLPEEIARKRDAMMRLAYVAQEAHLQADE
jgi:hypothetical protein